MKKVIIFVVLVLIIGGGFAANMLISRDNPIPKSFENSEQQPEPINTESVTVDPCTLFDEADIERIFKSKFEVGLATELQDKTSDGKPILSCEYRQINDGTSEGLANSYLLEVIIENFNSSENAEANKPAEPNKINKNEASISFARGSQLFQISISKNAGIDQVKDKARLEELIATKI